MEHLSTEATKPETVCRDCVFSVYDENIQIGCELHKLGKFESVGAVIDECVDEEGKGFFVIRDRYCVFWRSKDWAKGKKDLVSKVNSESKLKFKCIIYIDNDNSMLDVEKTLKSLLCQELKPREIVFVNNNSLIQPVGLKRLCNMYDLFFSIEQINANSLSEGLCVDVAASKTNANDYGYISVFHAGKEVPKDFFSKINEKIVNDLDRIIALEGKEGNGDVYQTKAYKMSGGNIDHEEEKEELFIEKIKRISESQECQHLVRKTEEIIQE